MYYLYLYISRFAGLVLPVEGKHLPPVSTKRLINACLCVCPHHTHKLVGCSKRTCTLWQSVYIFAMYDTGTVHVLISINQQCGFRWCACAFLVLYDIYQDMCAVVLFASADSVGGAAESSWDNWEVRPMAGQRKSLTRKTYSSGNAHANESAGRPARSSNSLLGETSADSSPGKEETAHSWTGWTPSAAALTTAAVRERVSVPVGLQSAEMVKLERSGHATAPEEGEITTETTTKKSQGPKIDSGPGSNPIIPSTAGKRKDESKDNEQGETGGHRLKESGQDLVVRQQRRRHESSDYQLPTSSSHSSEERNRCRKTRDRDRCRRKHTATNRARRQLYRSRAP